MIYTICEITVLPSGKFLVELLNADGSAAKVKVYPTLAGARGVCTRYARKWDGPVGITATYSDGEQRTYAGEL